MSDSEVSEVRSWKAREILKVGRELLPTGSDAVSERLFIFGRINSKALFTQDYAQHVKGG